MSIARNATRRHVGYGIFLWLVTACAVPGCGSKPPASAPAGGQQLALQQPQQPAPLSLERPATAATKPAGAADESAKERVELARTSATLRASQADAEKLRQELKAVQTNLRGWHNAYKAAQAQAAALQKTAAVLNERNTQLQRQEAEAAAALRDARETLGGQSPPIVPAMTPEAPAAAAFPAAAPPPVPAAAPSPLLGVLRDVRPFRGRPYATLSIGHDAGVRRGMRFGLADPRTGAPAGVVTIDEVGPEEAGGVVEGAEEGELRAGLWVHGRDALRR
jgi:hypothetical protein